MADDLNIENDDDWFIGCDYELPVTIYTTRAHTATQDITGWALSFMVKRRPTDADANAVIIKTTGGSGIALTTPGSGLLTVTIADTDTDTLAADTYWFEVRRTDAGFETVLTHGTAVLRQAVHR